ncbi:MAG: type II secretion system F family protein [Mycobacterium sp.]
MSTAALALALAVLLGAGPLAVRTRAGLDRPVRVAPRPPPAAADPLAGASSLDVLAVCLRAGLAVPTAARATARHAPPHLAAVLGRAADLLALGSDPDTAWAPTGSTDSDPHCQALLRLARRSAASGTALAHGVAELADEIRADAGHQAAASAERAAVLIAGPLGLCFLPAFVCLGIIPTVAGLAGDVFGSVL